MVKNCMKLSLICILLLHLLDPVYLDSHFSKYFSFVQLLYTYVILSCKIRPRKKNVCLG